jgi:hypothetical protein
MVAATAAAFFPSPAVTRMVSSAVGRVPLQNSPQVL